MRMIFLVFSDRGQDYFGIWDLVQTVVHGVIVVKIMLHVIIVDFDDSEDGKTRLPEPLVVSINGCPCFAREADRM